jgi:hypothetical protein
MGSSVFVELSSQSQEMGDAYNDVLDYIIVTATSHNDHLCLKFLMHSSLGYNLSLETCSYIPRWYLR